MKFLNQPDITNLKIVNVLDPTSAQDAATKNYVDTKIFSWSVVSGTSQAASVNNGYIANNAALVTITLPTVASIGSIVRVVGKGDGLFRIAQSAGDIIRFGNLSTTIGTSGYIESTHAKDAVELLCTLSNSEWTVISSIGNFTIN